VAVEDGDVVARIVNIASAVFREATDQLDHAARRSLLELDFVIRRKIADRVRWEFSGDSFYVPKALAAQKAKRNEAIRADRAAGLSLRAIACKHRLGKSQVATILKDER
jgi:Mor family transcriptional regulator